MFLGIMVGSQVSRVNGLELSLQELIKWAHNYVHKNSEHIIMITFGGLVATIIGARL